MSTGQPYEAFWDLTLAEVSMVMEGEELRLKREHNNRAWSVWHIEALARQKKMTPLKNLMHDEKPSGRRMTPDQIEAVTRSWLASRHKRKK